jgi:hypothetical protein
MPSEVDVTRVASLASRINAERTWGSSSLKAGGVYIEAIYPLWKTKHSLGLIG